MGILSFIFSFITNGTYKTSNLILCIIKKKEIRTLFYYNCEIREVINNILLFENIYGIY